MRAFLWLLCLPLAWAGPVQPQNNEGTQSNNGEINGGAQLEAQKSGKESESEIQHGNNGRGLARVDSKQKLLDDEVPSVNQQALQEKSTPSTNGGRFTPPNVLQPLNSKLGTKQQHDGSDPEQRVDTLAQEERRTGSLTPGEKKAYVRPPLLITLDIFNAIRFPLSHAWWLPADDP